jgi:DNA polymerase-3 subunit beta
MKIVCDSSQLSSAVGAVTRALAARTTMPVLEGVHVLAKNNTVKLSCTDLRFGIETILPAQVVADGEAVLPGKLFSEMARKLPEGEVEIATDGTTASISARGTRARLQALDGSEFPALPKVEHATTVMLSSETLGKLIHQSIFAAAVDESRPILTGVLLEFLPGTVRMVALDGFRLAVSNAEYTGEVKGVKAVVPAAALARVASLLGDDETVVLEIGPTHLGVTLSATKVIARLLEGEFLRYEQIIPTEWLTRINISRLAFSTALDRASMLAREGRSNLVRLKIGEDLLIVTSNSEAGDIYEEIPITREGRDLEIAFNSRFLTDVMKYLDADELTMSFTTAVNSAVIRAANSDAFTYLVLPVRAFSS